MKWVMDNIIEIVFVMLILAFGVRLAIDIIMDR